MNITAPWSAVVFKPKGINCLVHITEAAVLRSKLIEGETLSWEDFYHRCLDILGTVRIIHPGHKFT